MFTKQNTKFAKKNRETILPSRTALLLNDLIAVVLFAIAVSTAIVLATYNPDDRSWFSTANTMIVHNKFGVIGAYCSDLLLSVFGFSAWWFVIIIFYCGYRKIIKGRVDSGNWYDIAQVACFIFLIIASSIVEYFNLYSINTAGYLHYGYGGMLGDYLYNAISVKIGSLGMAIVSVVVFLTCFSIGFSISLGYLAEKVGFLIEVLYLGVIKLISHKDDREKSVNASSMQAQPDDAFKLDNNPRLNGTNQLGFLKNKFKNPFAKSADSSLDSGCIDNLEVPDGQEYGFDELFDELDNPDKDKRTDGVGDSKYKNLIPESLLNNFDNEVDTNSQGGGVFNKFKSLGNRQGKIVATYKRESKLNQIKNAYIDGAFVLPSTDLLDNPKKQLDTVSAETIEYVSGSIENKLSEFGVEAAVINAESGPVITRYEILPSRGVRGDKIVGLGKEIARGLALTNVRIVETIPGKNSMGIEVPNFKRQIIYLKEIFDSPVYHNSISKLTLALGKDIAGEVVVTDLGKMPHLLVAGTTGSGKSVAVNAMIMSILFQATPQEVKFIMIDPKMVELSFYQDIPHLLAPVVTDMQQATNALKWIVGEMERRYRVMAKVGCKNISAYNHKIGDAISHGEEIPNPLSRSIDAPEKLDKWPYIVVIIDELADLMMVTGKKIEQYIARIAQKARAVGIHLIVATQRPSVDVITGLIKANIPARISFQVSSKVDSRTILDQMGAETLLGQGDMLFMKPGSGVLHRVHGAYVSDQELNSVVDFLKSEASPEYVDGILEGDDEGTSILGLDDDSGNSDSAEKDSMFDEAVKFIYDSKRCSISSLQTRFGIGYNRAARIMAHLEQIGMVRRNERGGFELVKQDMVE